MASPSPKPARAAVSLDELRARPELVGGLPADVVAEILAAVLALQGAAVGTLLSLRGSSRSDPTLPRFIDAKTAAAQWGVPESWVYDQARQGKLPSVRLGHYVRFRPDDLERFIAEQRQGA